MVNITINGQKINVDENKNILDAALENGIYIPHLCHHPDLPELGSCRLCIVECSGYASPAPSCTIKAEEGMEITTDSDRISALRNLAMELILAAHPEDCSTCPKYGQCELQTLIQYMGVSAARVHKRIKGFPSSEQQLFIHDMNRCVLCGRCVRACNDLRGVKVLQYNKRDTETYVGTLHDKLLKDSGCRFCGACAEVCPTGTIRDIINYSPQEKRDVLIPCKTTCPAHTDIPRYLRFASKAMFSEATAVIREKLPFPASLGYICNHECESKCRRGDINSPVSIREVKRFAADNANNELWKQNSRQLSATGKKVCVVGGGPAGLTAAYYLAKQGHSVLVKEKNPKAGGQMQYGIPAYRLPRNILDREIAYITEAGLKIECGAYVEKPAELLKEYDAVLMCIGTNRGVRLPLKGSDLKGVIVNTDFLRNAALGEDTEIGKEVLVLGGGNVAFDCARTAKRLGASNVHVACLESLENMPADKEEIEQAQEEGVIIRPSLSFEEILGDDNASGVKFTKVISFTFDENNRAQIEKEEGSEFVIQADTVIMAVGQKPDKNSCTGIELDSKGYISVDGNSWATAQKGMYACGDVVYGTCSVVKAIASAREAAAEIDLYLGGNGDISEKLAPVDESCSYIGQEDNFAFLERAKTSLSPAEQRQLSFEQVDMGLSNTDVCGEAHRCLQCDLRFSIKPQRIWSNYNNPAGEGGTNAEE